MSPAQLAYLLKTILETDKTVFIKTYPEILDFTFSESECYLIIFNKTHEFKIPLNKDKLIQTVGLLNAAIFQDENITVLAWNIKSYFSYVKFYTKMTSDVTCNLWDLKPLEAFQCVDKPSPISLGESKLRIKNLLKEKSWDKLKNIYKKLHMPLITKVLPDLETKGIFDLSERKILHSQYEIEGQVNGRLRCFNAYKNSFNPHTIGSIEKDNYRPIRHDEVFLAFDYKNMEVSVLQWLTQDERLKQILDLDEDFYKVIFKLVTNMNCESDKHRDMAKRFFLPVIYGMQPEALSLELSISKKLAENIFDKINSLFKKPMDWISSFSLDDEHICYDVNGRKRIFEGDRYKNQLRNFLVQSPAALICLEKLVKLHNSFHGSIAYNLHDGYILYVNRISCRSTMLLAKEILESDGEMYPDIKLKVSCKKGDKLSEMNSY